MTSLQTPTISEPHAASPAPHEHRPSLLSRRVRFAAAFFVSFAVVFLGVIALHVLGNPAEFPTSTDADYGGLFPSPIVPNHSNRSWKSRRITALVAEGKPPQIVVLGSSRMMQFSPKVITSITGKRAFNYAAVGASPMEYLAQLNYLIHCGAKPQMIILGIDERAMFGMYRQWEGKIVEDWSVLRETPWERQLPLEWKAITQIRLQRTPEAIRQLIWGPDFEQRNPMKVGNLLLDDGYRIRVPNSIARQRRPWKPDQQRARLKKYIASRVKVTGDLFVNAKIDKRQVDYVYDILKLAKSQGIHVKVVMTPMQPYYAQAVLTGRAKKQIDGYATKLRHYCKHEHIDFYDCRDVKEFGGEDYEFWDEQHPTPVNAMRMANAVFGLKPRTPHPDVPDDADLVKNLPAVNSLSTW